MPTSPVDRARADASRLIWRAAVAADAGNLIAAAELLELAARHLRKAGVEPTRTGRTVPSTLSQRGSDENPQRR